MSFPLVTRYGALPLHDEELANKAYVDAGGGGGQTFARIVKIVDQSIVSNAVLQNDDELVVALNANKTYSFMMTFFYTSDAVQDFQYAFAIPAGASGEKINGTWQSQQDQNSSALATSQFVPTNNSSLRLINACGRIIVAGTAGNFQFQWAQQTSDPATCTVNQGSMLVIWEEL